MKRRIDLFLVALLIATLTACTALGVDTPQTFNQRAAAAQITVTAVRSQALTLLNAGKISAKDAANVQATADAGNAAIDLALATKSADPTAATDKLTAAIAVLTATQAYLTAKGGK